MNKKILLCAAIVLTVLCGCHKKEKQGDSVPDVAVSTAYTDSVVLHKTYPGRLEAASKADVVGEVQAFGSGEYSMRIWLDPEKMRGYGLTPRDVSAAIQSQNIAVSAGTVGAPPGSGDNQFEYTLVSRGRLASADEFRNIVLRHAYERPYRHDLCACILGCDAEHPGKIPEQGLCA